MRPPCLHVRRGQSRLILSIPHAGVAIPAAMAAGLISLPRARYDADWWLRELYGFADDLDATVIFTEISRTVIDVNRDPSGASLYPGQATTGLCPVTTFDGAPIYGDGMAPGREEIARRRAVYFDPFHAAISEEIARLRARHGNVVLYDCHSIRSRVPRLFEGALPHFNIGTNDGKACDAGITAKVAAICEAAPGFSHVVNGRFKGGFITRCHGRPAEGVQAIQMELACRGYLREPEAVDEGNWPGPYDPDYALPIRNVLTRILESLLR